MKSEETRQDELTSLMRQYFKIKEQYKDMILFFRFGDFYEMFGEDAKTASQILGITLTSTDKSKETATPMCEIPYFTAQSYIEKFLREGYKVAIYEQIEDTKSLKGIVEREVMKVLTPGTYLPEGVKENIYIMAVYPLKGKIGVALTDITTGQLIIYESDKTLVDEIERFDPKEVLLPKSLQDTAKFENIENCTFMEDWKFDYVFSYKALVEHFKITSLKSFGAEELDLAIQAAGALLRYLEENKQKTDFKELKVLNLYEYMLLDSSTKRNLEILSSLDGSKEGSLFWVLDETVTAMGNRFLRNALSCPLLNINEIQKRLDGVEAFFKDYILRDSVDKALKDFPDIERLTLKIKNENINAQEVKALKDGLKKIPELKKILLKTEYQVLHELSQSLFELDEVVSLIERFITDELKELESKILGAEEKLKTLEQELFIELIRKLQHYGEKILKDGETIAYIDFLCSLAKIASKYNYTRAEINEDEIIEVVEGRHPVIERLIQSGKLPEQRFIPNDLLIGSDDQRIIILTGPNMAGKSTYMRQNALIVLMAQTGSFVPAKKAKIGVVDRIFTCIGDSDYLVKGQNTFMVEMIETSNIINNATSKSLIILDEIGKGTSTFDGISIAWAVVEYIAEKIKARTLFATHYHELTDIAFSIDCVKNYTVVVKEWGDEIIFLRKIEKGGADKSYGIQVARLAGVPSEILNRAKQVLKRLEKREFQTFHPKARQIDLFFQGEPVIAEIAKIDIDSLTPQKAFKKLKELKEMIKND